MLGYSPYYVFPESMVRHVKSIYDLSSSIANLLDSYQYDEAATISYIAAHIKRSIPVNLFTDLLKKSGRTVVETKKSIHDQYRELATYTIMRINEEMEALAH